MFEHGTPHEPPPDRGLAGVRRTLASAAAHAAACADA
ncbi:hypothetical protein CLV63_1021, partial [Murinocardiopsis flavida]